MSEVQSAAPAPGSGQDALRWTPWRAVVVFGLVSLAADMVYEGMRALAVHHRSLLSVAIGVLQVVAFGLMIVTRRRARPAR